MIDRRRALLAAFCPRALLHERLFWQIAYLHYLQGGGGADKKR